MGIALDFSDIIPNSSFITGKIYYDGRVVTIIMSDRIKGNDDMIEKLWHLWGVHLYTKIHGNLYLKKDWTNIVINSGIFINAYLIERFKLSQQ